MEEIKAKKSIQREVSHLKTNIKCTKCGTNHTALELDQGQYCKVCGTDLAKELF